jgi:CBS domain-containing protein
MQVKKIMTKNPSCCTSDSTLQEVAHMMEMYDCGCIPVVEDHLTKRPIGTITDRDIVIRTFSANKNPLEMKASDIMTTDIVTVTPETDIDQCSKVMEEKQIRRVLVVDKDRRCVGIVAQADLAEHETNPADTAKFLREVSETESDRSREKQFQPQGSSDSDRVRYTQSHRSFSLNESSDKPRETQRKSYTEKESSSNGKIFLALLGTIGLGAGLKYYFGADEENKRRSFANRKINADRPEANIFTTTCNGSLFIAKDTVRFESDDNIHTFQTNDADIKQVKTNSAFRRAFQTKTGSFKIVLKTGED